MVYPNTSYPDNSYPVHGHREGARAGAAQARGQAAQPGVLLGPLQEAARVGPDQPAHRQPGSLAPLEARKVETRYTMLLYYTIMLCYTIILYYNTIR
jgi:hypothetical protein